ncbi:MAG TPA: polysaccharide deacetylase family protein [Puia sp.]|jgi:peptidoglycan/xylan/chitin deacetylase (PgdA/CDA1 family)
MENQGSAQQPAQKPAQKLRVLMYHSVSADGLRDGLTVDSEQLEEHFRYLQTNGYSTIGLSELVAFYDRGQPLPENPVLVTFDDGFLNNYEIAYPLAEKYKIKINFFLVPAFILIGNYKGQRCLGPEEIKKMDPSLVEIGLHSFDHRNYADLTPVGVEQDLDRCLSAMDGMGILYQPCLAYPYGAYPRRKGHDQDQLFSTLEKNGIRLAFRIGNRLNRLPLRERFLVQRLDIRGDESMRTFRLSLAYGKRSTAWLTPFLRKGDHKLHRHPASLPG